MSPIASSPKCPSAEITSPRSSRFIFPSITDRAAPPRPAGIIPGAAEACRAYLAPGFGACLLCPSIDLPLKWGIALPAPHLTRLRPIDGEHFSLTHDQINGGLLQVWRVSIPGKQLADFDAHFRSHTLLLCPINRC